MIQPSINQDRTPIAVLGAGSWGTALALLLAKNNNPVRLWGANASQLETVAKYRENQRYLPGFTIPDNVVFYHNLQECLANVQDVLIVVPSQGFRYLVEQIKDIKTDIRLSWGTKGLDPGTHLLPHQVVAEVFSNKIPVAALVGPSFAHEVAAEKPTAVSIAGNDSDFVESLIQRFHSPHFRIYKNSDLIGVQVCGAIKNVIAIAVGVADGLQMGANTRAALITRALAEVSRLTVALGGEHKTVMSLAGIGDLVLTCTDDQSRNRRFGLAMARKLNVEQALQEIGQVVEGLGNAQHVYELAKSLGVEMPITEQVYGILYQGVSPLTAVNNLLSRSLRSE